MERTGMIKNLHELDKRLSAKVEIHICGASAAILQNALKRASYDIDVVQSSVSLNDLEMRKILDQICKPQNERESWLNDRARETIIKRFPESYKFDQVLIEGEIFERLHPMLISNADFVICKLVLDKEMRPRDIQDVKNIELKEHDVKRIYKKLDMFSIEKPGKALMIEGLFKEMRPELVITRQGYLYRNENEIAEYVKSRYGVNPDKGTIESWKENIDNNRPASIIIGKIDYKMGIDIENGNSELVSKDSAYRKR